MSVRATVWDGKLRLNKNTGNITIDRQEGKPAVIKNGRIWVRDNDWEKGKKIIDKHTKRQYEEAFKKYGK